MTSKKLKLQHILELEIQLSGFDNGVTSVKGILSEKINIKTKYWLGRLSDQVKKEKDRFNELRNELIKKHGEEIDGTWQIKTEIDGKPNPAIQLFSDEINSLANEEIEINFPELNLDAFDFESENDYTLLMNYVLNEN